MVNRQKDEKRKFNAEDLKSFVNINPHLVWG